MNIEYKKQEVIETKHKIEIDDICNCFLQGADDNLGLTEYLGIWPTIKGFIVCKIIHQDRIEIQLWRDNGTFCYSSIKGFLSEHKNVQKIKKETFMNFLEHKLENIIQM